MGRTSFRRHRGRDLRIVGWATTFSALLVTSLLSPDPAGAGLKVGAYIPQSSDYDTGLAISFDGRFRVTDRLKLGFELLYVPTLGGTKIGYSDDGFLDGGELETSTLRLLAATTGGWWFFTDHVYGGLGIGFYATEPADLRFDKAYSSDSDPPDGFAAQAALGLMQKPVGRHHFLLFGELSYHYCAGSGSLVDPHQDGLRTERAGPLRGHDLLERWWIDAVRGNLPEGIRHGDLGCAAFRGQRHGDGRAVRRAGPEDPGPTAT